ncbi:MAG: Calcineurin-like protein phosphoesterase family protein [Candidatus Magasanikbacteria bacterium GW2011_GWC2_40_17]|uniref:Calcineurin-like protein phosphoesterase family protein n=1 Tax=Candidatus Magasanikbacteria bacterium GW2011_GWA2_42_32 TaxID=1619039 RepID=A0A0G1A6V5_9BACT|nr:MAG: Calcineurin-like protein phosphoesterase family protein [Candidatus Magasanikbacteria bacterium GW2011_GWC2_40_17]KKS56772.1 MAG: Calcineurin-like protein phosphoesterase family protein [Candidatus Magasanikbacteria bacterium GW2011_GWA2_42_32]
MLPLFLFVGLILSLKIQLEPYQLTIREQAIETGKLKQEIQVALISDTHLRPLKRGWFLEKTAQNLQIKKPDLIFLAGDFLFHDQMEKFTPDFSAFKKFSDIAPTYAVLGNHDYGIADFDQKLFYIDQHQKIIELLEEVGVKVLIDENVTINIKDSEISLVGFDEFWHKEKNPAKAIAGLKQAALIIGISHNPDAAYLPESQNLDMILSGHTHGGQMRLPLIGSLAEAQTVFPRVDYGAVLLQNKPIIANTVGLGESGFPIRFFNRPEILILQIK